MSQQTSTETASQPSPASKANRELSWRVASNLFVSFRYAWAGLHYAFRTQRNFRIHLLVGTVALGLGVYLQLTAVEMAIIGLTIGAVLTMELLNTAIESVVDLTVKQSYHDLAKIAKDCAAGAVLTSALAAVIVAGSLLLPPLLQRILLWVG
ncbi:MAG: diacylglycerol kinase family protein [Leptolyngbya sp. DLM2.Bin15]|nr:MAG: diacylglycerol kinase family protein [Leptolyngbya sp. DLM2.Bin15]